MDEHLRWREDRLVLLERCGIFDLYRSERTSGDGKRGIFHLLKAPDWVNVVPLLPAAGGAELLLMVRQYRQGLGCITAEFPAGLLEPGESPEAAAARELLEETGYRAATLTPIGSIAANPAFMSNWCHTFCAAGLTRSKEQNLDALERLEVREIALAELYERVGSGEYINSMTVIALHWYLRYRGGKEG